jgi:hypothetical protein
MASVALAEINSVRNTQGGTSHGPQPGTFGLASVPTAGIEWAPTGGNMNVGPFAGAINNGIGPTEQTVTSLDSFEHISYSYMAPSDLGDGSDLQIMSRMPVFICRHHNVEDESTVVLPLMKLNKMAQDQWNDFVQRTAGPAGQNPMREQEYVEFYDALVAYGERGLEAYAWAREHHNRRLVEQYESQNIPGVINIRTFYERSIQSGFCYLTRYGWLHKVNFAGVVINTNRAETLLGLDDTLQREHYLQVNVGYAKRIECAQQWGDNEEIVTGARLWITLTRKKCGGPDGGYGAFVLIPGGSKGRDTPLYHERSYADESGAVCQGYVWRVGIVITPPDKLPSKVAQERANNTGDAQDERLAYAMHASLPSLYVALGYKH